MAPPPPPADPLSSVTAAILRREDGVEGGFATPDGRLRGYAFPTHEGPGPTKEMPQREQPTIEQLARVAVASGATQSVRFEGPHDAVLFVAAPVRGAGGRHAGAAWLMQRIPGYNGEQNRQLLLASLGFGLAALVTALVAFFVMTEIRGGVQAVLDRLHALEDGLGRQPRPLTFRPLKEFGEVLHGIDRLGLSLYEKIQSERALEAELRHKERLSALGQFAAGVAHELRNPLATIRLRTQMSQRSPESVARNSDVVLAEVDRLDTMIGRLLSFARPIALALQPVELDDLCRSVVAAWAARNLPVTLELAASSGVIVACDQSRFVQVLDNLLENAVQAASSTGGGHVSVSTGRSGDTAFVEIVDSGSGFSSAALKHALDPFFTTKETGTGLGLSIAFEVIEAHGGTLRLANHPQGGGAVTLVLPLTPADGQRHSAPLELGNHG